MKRLFTVVLLIALSSLFTFAQSETVKENKTVKNTHSTTSAVTYDFTTGQDKFYGGDQGAVQLETGVWGMIAGDANGDGIVKYNGSDNDKNAILGENVYSFLEFVDSNGKKSSNLRRWL